jgi:branched-subunit amino acid aminotransferase/4-amino-4-deoxychorismate lyase
MGRFAYVDGKFVDETAPALPVSDRGFLFGETLFETLRTFSGRPFLLDRHLQRLRAGLAMLDIVADQTDEELKDVVLRLVAMNGADDQRVRLTVSAGSDAGLVGAGPRRGRVVVASMPLAASPAAPKRVVFYPAPRASSAKLAGLKTGNYLSSIEALRYARERGADDAIFTRADLALESAVANVFALIDGALVTPPVELGLLGGITRAFLLELAAQNGIFAAERPLAKSELLGADEAFLTNSVVGLARIGRLEETAFCEEPSETFKKLEKLYEYAVGGK